jgi:hypothetical protein
MPGRGDEALLRADVPAMTEMLLAIEDGRVETLALICPKRAWARLTGKSVILCPPPFPKTFAFLSKANHFISRAVSLPKGAYRDRHERGAGCGGRESIARRANTYADGEVVWS